MTDEEFEELKRKVAREEERRRRIQAKKEYLEYMEKGFGLQQPNGWCMNMKIKIIQDVDMLQGVDGNGGIEHCHHEANLNKKECDLLFRAFEEMAETCRKDIELLEDK